MPPEPDAHARPAPGRMTPGAIVLTITLLLALQPITTDLYLPSLPTLQRELGASIGATQLTLSVLIICFGIAQPVCGPVSDRFGRRPVLLAGMALYTVASVLAAAAQSIEALIGWRALQGAALAAAVTCGRALVRDLFQPQDGARVMSRALGGLGVAAMLAPLVGGLLVQFISWHAALLATAVFGAVTLGFIALKFDETLPQRNPRATAPAELLRNWGTVLAHPTFRAWTLLLCCTWGGLFFVLAGSSFVFIEMRGTSRLAYGVILASCSLAYIGQPCAQAGVVGPFPDKAGTAASLSGFAMTVTALAIGLFLGQTLDHSALPVTLGVGGFSILLAAVAWTQVQRHGDPADAWHAPIEAELAR